MVFVLRRFLDGRRLLRLRLIAVSVLLHTLGKFADVVEIATYLGVVFVNETAGLFRLFSPRIMNNDFAAVWNAELLIIMGVNETDALLGFLDMPVKPLFHIAVAVKVIVALCRVAAEQESVFVGIHTEAVLGAVIPFHRTFGETSCKRTHIIAVMQKPLIFTERVDNLVKLCLKLVRFPLLSGVKPSSIKAIARGGKIATQMPDTACLPCNLRTLGIGVFLFGLC